METNKRLKELREERKLSQAAIASLLDIKPGTYSTYETGRCDLSSDMIVKLCEYYKVSADYLLGISNEVTEEPVLSELERLLGAFSISELQEIKEFCSYLLWKKKKSSAD